jgi:hypothetical protein
VAVEERNRCTRAGSRDAENVHNRDVPRVQSVRWFIR